MSHPESNMQAIQTLIESLDNNNSIGTTTHPNLHLNFAKRILSSSIGEVTSNQGHVRRTPSSLLKKIERSYRKRVGDGDADGDANGDADVENKMKQVRALQEDLKNSELDDDLVSNVLLLFSRLVGTGRSGKGSGNGVPTTTTTNSGAFASSTNDPIGVASSNIGSFGEHQTHRDNRDKSIIGTKQTNM